jgi:transposase InsO family protein
MLQPFLAEHGIKIGRDALFDLLAEYKLLIIRRRRRVRTTFSAHGMRKYPDLIKGLLPAGANKVWVSDITYYKIGDEHVYISFVTDAYSRKIVGYQVADSLHAVNSVKALQMAIRGVNTNFTGLIHHSDRGTQYCAADYVAVLEKHKIAISMTETSDPRDNAIAERVNGIIKEEYLNHYQIKTKKEIYQKLHEAVHNYNHYRPHLSCNMNVPDDVHQNSLPTDRLWKNYYRKPILVNVKQDCPETVNQ